MKTKIDKTIADRIYQAYFTIYTDKSANTLEAAIAFNRTKKLDALQRICAINNLDFTEDIVLAAIAQSSGFHQSSVDTIQQEGVFNRTPYEFTIPGYFDKYILPNL